ncbi:MAG: hypothetical protein HYY50_00685 [Candidatus Kerfeldbacteria bacterium]|nr:hypothetical protein [Candidatus Kerfeldbacteria bacterium]
MTGSQESIHPLSHFFGWLPLALIAAICLFVFVGHALKTDGAERSRQQAFETARQQTYAAVDAARRFALVRGDFPTDAEELNFAIPSGAAGYDPKLGFPNPFLPPSVSNHHFVIDGDMSSPSPNPFAGRIMYKRLAPYVEPHYWARSGYRIEGYTAYGPQVGPTYVVEEVLPLSLWSEPDRSHPSR